MATVISNDKISRHNVNKYNFKVLSLSNGSEEDSSKTPRSNLIPSTQKEEPLTPIVGDKEVDSSGMTPSSKDSLIESLLKKTDEMSSNFIKLQMKLEDKEEEYKLELERVKKESFEEGVVAGKAQASKDTESSYTSGVAQFSTSVATLEKSAQDYAVALDGIKGELITAALDISKEVIKVELSSSSEDIAKVLSTELIKELQNASKVTLKVNPKDHGAISEHIGSLAHVEVISDSAVSQGGVIAISDAGNIDAQISKRFERVKRAALSE